MMVEWCCMARRRGFRGENWPAKDAVLASRRFTVWRLGSGLRAYGGREALIERGTELLAALSALRAAAAAG
jgi:hypothetical protein